MAVNDTTMEKFNLMLSILEPLVINEENARLATSEGVIKLLGKVLMLQDAFFSGIRNTIDPIQSATPVQKLALRSLVSCIRCP